MMILCAKTIPLCLVYRHVQRVHSGSHGLVMQLVCGEPKVMFFNPRLLTLCSFGGTAVLHPALMGDLFGIRYDLHYYIFRCFGLKTQKQQR